MKRVYIALGGNLGDVPATFNSARLRIAALPKTSITISSLLYRTPPIGPPGQPDYCNAIIAAKTGLQALALLDALQSIEKLHGRLRSLHWGPRTLDLDIIALDTEIIALPRLSIPHPLMHERQFVLRPLCDIEPGWHHPVLGKSASCLLADLSAGAEPPLADGIVW